MSLDEPARSLRIRQLRNFLASLMLSQGVPMILGGDELAQTQQGNNNTYCQDNELTWLNWKLGDEEQKLLTFVRRVIALRREQPVLQSRKFFQGRSIRGADIKDLTWLEPTGQEMNDEAWDAGFVRCLGVRLAGDLIQDLDERGQRIIGDTLLVLFNAHHEMIQFTLPEEPWELVLDTWEGEQEPFTPGAKTYPLQGRSLAVLKLRKSEAEGGESAKG